MSGLVGQAALLLPGHEDDGGGGSGTLLPRELLRPSGGPFRGNIIICMEKKSPNH